MWCYFIIFLTLYLSLVYTVNYFYLFPVYFEICNIKLTSQCKILIVPEEGWFGQPKYSTPTKNHLYNTLRVDRYISTYTFSSYCQQYSHLHIDVHVLSIRFHKLVHSVRPRLYGEKLSRVEGSPAYPSYPGRANFSYISLQNLANRLHEKQKVGSTRRVTRLAGSPFCDGRVALRPGPTLLHINTLARLAGSTRSRKDERNHARALLSLQSQLLTRAEGSTFLFYKPSVKLPRLGGRLSCPGQLFSI